MPAIGVVTTMSVASSGDGLFEAIKRRHRMILLAGVAATVVGVLLAGFVGYEWFVRRPRVSHEVLAVIAAFAVLVGVQLLVFSTLTDMLVVLHQEQLRRLDED